MDRSFNNWMQNHFNESILNSFPKKFFYMLHEQTSKRLDKYDPLKMNLFSNIKPPSTDVPVTESSFTTNMEIFDILFNECENNQFTSTPNCNRIKKTDYTDSLSSSPEINQNETSLCKDLRNLTIEKENPRPKSHKIIFNSHDDETTPTKCIKIKVVVPKSKPHHSSSILVSPSLPSLNLINEKTTKTTEIGIIEEKVVPIKRQTSTSALIKSVVPSPSSIIEKRATSSDIGKIVEELVLERYKPYLSNYAIRSKKRTERKKPETTLCAEEKDNNHLKEMLQSGSCMNSQISIKSVSEASECYNKVYFPQKPPCQELYCLKSMENLGYKFLPRPLSIDDYSVSTGAISELLTTRSNTATDYSYLYTVASSIVSYPYNSTPMFNQGVQEVEEEEVEYCEANSIDSGIAEGLMIQDRIIQQISNVIQFAKQNKNWEAYIEAQRLLLITNYEKRCAVRRREASRPNLNSPGVVSISSMTFPAAINDFHVPSEKNKSVYYVCLLSCNKFVTCSTTIQQDIDGMIRFTDEFVFSNLTSDFSIEASIFALENYQQISTNTFLCQSDNENHFRLFPKKLQMSKRRSKTPDEKDQDSSFKPIGNFVLNIQNIKNFDGFTEMMVKNTSSNLRLHGSGRLKIKCDIIDRGLRQFVSLNVGSKRNGDSVQWSRLWGCIGKMELFFWKYPKEEQNNPLLTIDLKRCRNAEVLNASKEICLRPRTLQLEDFESMTYFLSFDKLDDLVKWKDELNSLLPWIKLIFKN